MADDRERKAAKAKFRSQSAPLKAMLGLFELKFDLADSGGGYVLY